MYFTVSKPNLLFQMQLKKMETYATCVDTSALAKCKDKCLNLSLRANYGRRGIVKLAQSYMIISCDGA